MSISELRKITSAEIDMSKISPPKDSTMRAKVVKVYDGDTCHLVVSMKRKLEKYRCRLAYIDTPEMNSDLPEERKKAEKSRDFLTWLCIGEDPAHFSRRSKPWSERVLQDMLDVNTNLVYVDFQKPGRYGRPIVVLKKDREADRKESFNQLLLNHGYAEPY